MFRRSLLQQLHKYSTKPSLSTTKSPINQFGKQSPIITCKQKQFNLNRGQKYPKDIKFGDIELATNGWKHPKSKGDFFTIHPLSVERLPGEFGTNNSSETSPAATLFDKLGLDERIVENLQKNFSINKCTYVQQEAIPQILAGDHALIAAETGCGKTLAYLVPVIQQLLAQKQKQNSTGLRNMNFNTPLALVLTPGRELATQIGEVAEKICENLGISVSVLLGGRTKQKMLNPSFDDVDLLIGTIGATSKLVTTGVYRMQQCQHVILDEADTLLDDSFNSKLVHFLKRFPFYRNQLSINSNTAEISTQLILASATMPTNIQELLQSVIDPTTVHEIVGTELHRILPNLEQNFLRMNKTGRPMQLLRLVKTELEKHKPLIVFSNRSATCDFVSMFLNENGVGCVNLNGDMHAEIRLGKFREFQTGQFDVLSSTDVASRGLDTTRARHIVNFDFPLHMADYIHRIGRTGRVGSREQCTITNFISSLREIDLVQRIEHTARTASVLPNVNANVTNIIKRKIMKEMNLDDSQMGRHI